METATKTRPVYKVLANCIQARLNFLNSDDTSDNAMQWVDTHEEKIAEIVEHLFPSGSGFDNGTKLNLQKSTGEKLVFETSYHHMNDAGFYTEWTDHTITVTPSLLHDFHVHITGKNVNDTKDYIVECFNTSLIEEIEL